ncbi:MAG: signal peptide peptidase SppA [Spirochaetales bacterium]|nr:signal peptide peptidase SppA [Spirochaetales bacterium]MCF7937398.1 signal peptide peptidase SppA [Spirochaetales bacterium]
MRSFFFRSSLVFGSFLVFFTVMTFPGFTQQNGSFGSAVYDRSLDYRNNPAALATGLGNGLGVRQGIDLENPPGNSEEVFEDFGLHLAFAPFAYDYEYFNGLMGHRFTFAVQPAEPFSIGFSGRLSGTSGMDIENYQAQSDIGLLFRPHAALSVSSVVRGLSLEANPEYIFGLGVRPLFFDKYWGSRLSVGVDTVMNSEGAFRLPSAVLETEPADGVLLRGGYDFEDKSWFAGLSLSLFRGTAGSRAIVRENNRRLENKLFLHVDKHRSFLPSQRPRAYELEDDVYLEEFRTWSLPMESFVPGRRVGVYEYGKWLERLEAQENVEAVVIRNQHLFAGMAQREAFLDTLQNMKRRGTRIIVYMDEIYNFEYPMLASLADTLVLNPRGFAEVRGLSMSRLYLRDLLAEWGVEVYNFRSSPAKSFGNFLSEAGMPEEERKNLSSYLESLQGYYLELVSRGRGERLAGGAEKVISEGPYMTARSAVDAGIVDRLMYEEEFDSWLEDELEGLSVVDPRLPEPLRYDWADSEYSRVALVYAEGDIVKAESEEGTIGSDDFPELLDRLGRDDRYQAVLLRINSGGGSAFASDLIYRSLEKFVDETDKLLVVSMGRIAASGGYYIATAADHIIAAPTSKTGSIGVVMLRPSFQGLLERFHINRDTVKTSENADMLDPMIEPSETEVARLQESVEEHYRRFLSVVSKTRDIDSERLEDLAGGRIWTGRQAKEAGLIDDTGSLMDALSYIEEQTGRPVLVDEYLPADSGLFRFFRLFSALSEERMKEAVLEALPGELREAVEAEKLLQEFGRDRPLYWDPSIGLSDTALERDSGRHGGDQIK